MLEPALPQYLSIPYAAKPSQRGGTLVAEDVVDRQSHLSRVADPDGYRPSGCPRCNQFLQGHGCRWRHLRDEPETAEEMIRRYQCVFCSAVWQVLPAFIARHLHRTWGAVQSRLVAAKVLERSGTERRVDAKPTTTWRYVRRMAAIAIVLTQVLTESGGERVGAVVKRLGLHCSRAALVEGLAAAGVVDKRQRMGQLAGYVHRLVPGVRLM